VTSIQIVWCGLFEEPDAHAQSQNDICLPFSTRRLRADGAGGYAGDPGRCDNRKRRCAWPRRRLEAWGQPGETRARAGSTYPVPSYQLGKCLRLPFALRSSTHTGFLYALESKGRSEADIAKGRLYGQQIKFYPVTPQPIPEDDVRRNQFARPDFRQRTIPSDLRFFEAIDVGPHRENVDRPRAHDRTRQADRNRHGHAVLSQTRGTKQTVPARCARPAFMESTGPNSFCYTLQRGGAALGAAGHAIRCFKGCCRTSHPNEYMSRPGHVYSYAYFSQTVGRGTGIPRDLSDKDGKSSMGGQNDRMKRTRPPPVTGLLVGTVYDRAKRTR